jgi:hypothetical protein
MALGATTTPQTAKPIQKVPDFIGSNPVIRSDRGAPFVATRRSALIRNAQQTEFFGGGLRRKIVSPDSSPGYGASTQPTTSASPHDIYQVSRPVIDFF